MGGQILCVYDWLVGVVLYLFYLYFTGLQPYANPIS